MHSACIVPPPMLRLRDNTAYSSAWPPAAHELELGRQALQSSAALLQGSEAFLSTSVAAALAVGVVNLGVLPPKLNSVIQPLVGDGVGGGLGGRGMCVFSDLGAGSGCSSVRPPCD